jgi:hypothetical protein
MTPEEVKVIAESAGFRNIKDDRLSVHGDDTVFVDRQRWIVRDPEWGDLFVIYTRPPAESRVVHVKGGIKGQTFPHPQLQEALIAKYGDPTEVREATAATGYLWYHGGANDSERCYTANYLVTIIDCSGIQLIVRAGKRQGHNSLIYTLSESSLADMGVATENMRAFKEYATEFARQRESERMENVDAPKL